MLHYQIAPFVHMPTGFLTEIVTRRCKTTLYQIKQFHVYKSVTPENGKRKRGREVVGGQPTTPSHMHAHCTGSMRGRGNPPMRPLRGEWGDPIPLCLWVGQPMGTTHNPPTPPSPMKVRVGRLTRTPLVGVDGWGDPPTSLLLFFPCVKLRQHFWTREAILLNLTWSLTSTCYNFR